MTRREDDDEQRVGPSAPVGSTRTQDAQDEVAALDRAERERHLARLFTVAGATFLLLVLVFLGALASIGRTNATIRARYVEIQMYDAELDCGRRPPSPELPDCAARDRAVLEMWRIGTHPSWGERVGAPLARFLSLDAEPFENSLPYQRRVVEGYVRGALRMRAMAGLPGLAEAREVVDVEALLDPQLGVDRHALLTMEGGDAFFAHALALDETRAMALAFLTEAWLALDQDLRFTATSAPELTPSSVPHALAGLDVLRALEPALVAAAQAEPTVDLVVAVWRARGGASLVDAIRAYHGQPIDPRVIGFARLLRPAWARADADARAAVAALAALPALRGIERILLHLVVVGGDDALGRAACEALAHQSLHNPAWTLGGYSRVVPYAGCPVTPALATEIGKLTDAWVDWPRDLAALFGPALLSVAPSEPTAQAVAVAVRLDAIGRASSSSDGAPRRMDCSGGPSAPCRRDPRLPDARDLGAFLRAER